MTARPRGTHLICTLIWNLLFCARAVLFSRSFSSLALYSREGRRPWRWRHRGWIPSRDGYVRRTRDGVGSPGLFRPVCSMASYIHACITCNSCIWLGFSGLSTSGNGATGVVLQINEQVQLTWGSVSIAHMLFWNQRGRGSSLQLRSLLACSKITQDH